MIAYKLVKKRKDGTLGPLFIDTKFRYVVGPWLIAEDHPTKGFAHRPGFHCTSKPEAPHLRTGTDRTWIKVEIQDYTEHVRPANQGGLWYLAKKLRVLETELESKSESKSESSIDISMPSKYNTTNPTGGPR